MPSQQATVATIEIKSEDDGSLWVYLVSDNERLSPIREVTWWGDLDKTAECWIGVYVAKPAQEKTNLRVHFEGFVVDAIRKF